MSNDKTMEAEARLKGFYPDFYVAIPANAHGVFIAKEEPGSIHHLAEGLSRASAIELAASRLPAGDAGQEIEALCNRCDGRGIVGREQAEDSCEACEGTGKRIYAAPPEQEGDGDGDGDERRRRNDVPAEDANQFDPKSQTCAFCSHALHEGLCLANENCGCIQYPSLRGIKVAPAPEGEVTDEKDWETLYWVESIRADRLATEIAVLRGEAEIIPLPSSLSKAEGVEPDERGEFEIWDRKEHPSDYTLTDLPSRPEGCGFSMEQAIRASRQEQSMRWSGWQARASLSKGVSAANETKGRE